jgi:hypothetical protein
MNHKVRAVKPKARTANGVKSRRSIVIAVDDIEEGGKDWKSCGRAGFRGEGQSFRFDRLKGLGVLAGGQDWTRDVLKR